MSSDNCPHEVVEDNVCMDCGWSMSSFDFHGNSDYGNGYRSNVEYVSVLEVELSRLPFDDAVKEQVLSEMRRNTDRRSGSRRQMMYAIIMVVHLQLKKLFDYDIWKRYFESKKQDITVPLKLASGLLGRPVASALAEIVVVSPIGYLSKVTEILKVSSLLDPICDLAEKCLSHERDLYEENPHCTAVAFVKYYIQKNKISNVTNIAVKCGVTASIINKIVQRIKDVVADLPRPTPVNQN